MKTVLLLIILLFSQVCAAAPPANFAQAKKIAAAVFKPHPITLYCQCHYQNKQIDLASCQMEAAADKKRALRLEWEHMMPAENFGRQFACWRVPLCRHSNGSPYKGRACCEKIEPRFRQAEAELYNLWPEVGLLNQLRSNYRYAELPGKPKTYGCEFYVDSATRRIEPADAIKGLVARANLFMAERYGIALSSAQQQLFIAWHRQFPPSAWEKEWAAHVAGIEGYSNPWID